MGLLDDAIREHLELKRQHGADPDEVSRQENEAFGAARRAEFARTGEDAGSATAADAPAEDAAAAPAEPEPVAEASAPPAVEEPLPPEEAVPPPPEPEPEPEPPEPFAVEAVEPAPPAFDEPPAPDPAAPPSRDVDPWLDDERDEVPADESLDRPPPGGAEEPAEDVLEETPDFLQETPEHDRLWFEQRPPRDFDWDK